MIRELIKKINHKDLFKNLQTDYSIIKFKRFIYAGIKKGGDSVWSFHTKCNLRNNQSRE